MFSKKNVRLESLFILSEIISPSGDREKIKQEILSDSIDWLSVVEIANSHFLTAALYYSLLDKDLLNIIDDEELLTYLEQIYTINLHRNQGIIEQSKEIAQILLKTNIKPVFLKGAASLLQNDYIDVGMRFLSDIDFCVFENDFVKSREQLLSSGYIPNIIKIKVIEKHHHWWPMYHPDWDVVIELHKFILTFPYTHLLNCEKSNSQNSDGHTNAAILSPSFRLIHTYLHSDMVDRSYSLKKIDLRQLYEMSIIIDNYQSQIDWVYVDDFFKKHKMWDKFNYKLCLIAELFNVHSPIMRQNNKCKIHLEVLYMFFKHQNTFLTNLFTDVQNNLFGLSYRRIRQDYGASSKKEYFYSIYKKLKKHIL